MVALPEDPVNIFMAELEMRDLQALTPDMILHEPEYWNRYELEVGEEGEGGNTGYEPILSDEGPPGGATGSGWPHFGAYIASQVSFSPSEEIRSEEETSTRHNHGTEQGAVALDMGEIDDSCQLEEGIPRGHDSNTPLNELLCQWNTQSTIGDVLRDFHWIIAYVLEGMQQYEAGMAPWPRVSQGFGQRVKNFSPEDTGGDISIASASRRVLSLLEGTGIPQTSSKHGGVASRASRIPRPAKKEPKVETVPGCECARAQEIMDQRLRPVEANQSAPLGSLGHAIVNPGVVNVALSERPDNVQSIDTRLSRTLNWSVMGGNERDNTSRSPDKWGDRHSWVVDLGHTGSKIPVLSPRPDGGNVPSMKTGDAEHKFTPKGGESPRRGRRSKLMAGEMQVPVEMHLSRGRKVTRDNSPLIGRPDVALILSAQRPENFTYLEKDEEDVLEEVTVQKKKDSGLDKENRRPDA